MQFSNEPQKLLCIEPVCENVKLEKADSVNEPYFHPNDKFRTVIVKRISFKHSFFVIPHA